VLILVLRTDKPQSELHLFKDHECLKKIEWHAHRALATTIHHQINSLLTEQQISLDAVEGLLVYEGPGSFTGLRIGMSVANALRYSLTIPIQTAHGDDWLEKGVSKLLSGAQQEIALPRYGAGANITKPKR